MNHEEHLELTKKEQALRINYPIGSQVIIKDNSSKPYQVGTVIGTQRVPGNVFPIVDVEGEALMIMGIIRRHDPRVTKALDKLTGVEQWNVMAEWYIIDEEE